MGQPLSMDLRSRLLAAIDEGLCCRAAAARFGVVPSTAIRWQAQRRETGSFAPKPQGGDMRSRWVEERREDKLGDAIRYALTRRDGLSRFIDDGVHVTGVQKVPLSK